MNGTIIEIPGISVSVIPIELEDSTDTAHLITISDGKKEISIQVAYGKIINSTIK